MIHVHPVHSNSQLRQSNTTQHQSQSKPSLKFQELLQITLKLWYSILCAPPTELLRQLSWVPNRKVSQPDTHVYLYTCANIHACYAKDTQRVAHTILCTVHCMWHIISDDSQATSGYSLTKYYGMFQNTRKSSVQGSLVHQQPHNRHAQMTTSPSLIISEYKSHFDNSASKFDCRKWDL